MSISNYTQEITIPSLGYLNPEIPGGKLIQRCMMVSDQKFLAGSDLNPDSTVQELIRRTIESPENFNVGNLTTIDTLYILFKLRMISYGDDYKFTAKCPECGKKIDMHVDLSKIEVETLDPDYSKKLFVVLPRAGDKVYTKFLRNDDLSEIKEEIKRRSKKGVDTNEFVLRLSSMITKIELKEKNKDGDSVLTHPVDIQNYVEKLTDLDATAIRATTDSIMYGITPTIEHKCPHCKEYVDIYLSMGPGFFRPKYDI